MAMNNKAAKPNVIPHIITGLLTGAIVGLIVTRTGDAYALIAESALLGAIIGGLVAGAYTIITERY